MRGSSVHVEPKGVSHLCLAGVMPHCLDPGTVDGVSVEVFDGQEWEKSMAEHEDIRRRSQE